MLYWMPSKDPIHLHTQPLSLRVEYEDGWGLLRASNTTPKLVLRFEGTSQKSLDDIIRKFNDEFQKVHPNLDKIIDQI